MGQFYRQRFLTAPGAASANLKNFIYIKVFKMKKIIVILLVLIAAAAV